MDLENSGKVTTVSQTKSRKVLEIIADERSKLSVLNQLHLPPSNYSK